MEWAAVHIGDAYKFQYDLPYVTDRLVAELAALLTCVFDGVPQAVEKKQRTRAR